MNEGASKRREWVKNAAIIFLSVMLVLTFFSNTIMNYSLPEVATVYVQPGSITAKVRGTGNVEATDPYNVIAKESRVIQSVAVKQGDEVEKEDVLYYLEDTDSEELRKAEAELDSMVLAYMLQLFDGTTTPEIINKVESGKTDSFAAYQSKIAGIQNSVKAADNNVAAHQANVDSLTKQLSLLTNSSNPDTTAEQEEVTNAQKNLTGTENSIAQIQANLSNLESKKSEIQALIAEAESLIGGDIDSLQTSVNASEAALKKAIKDYLGVDKTLEEALNDAAIKSAFTEKRDVDIAGGVTDAEDKYNAAVSAYNVAKATYNAAKKALENGTKVLQNYNKYLSQLSSVENEIQSVKQELADATKNQTNAKGTLTTAQQVLENKTENKSNADAQIDIKNKLVEAETALKSAQADRDKVKEEQDLLIANLQAELNLENKNNQITLKKEEIERLKEKSMGAAITAPVTGTVMSVAYVAGETTKPEEAAAVIQVAGKGFTVSFPVTNEQAKKVQVGDTADLTNAWYYPDVQVILTAIRPDPDNPGQKKLLTFTLSGSEIQAGQALNITVGQRSANYELIVPNSGIREDNNGKFILIVEPKSSPLGNRYFATRVDVEVLASDDTNTAVSGALYGYEYVITTATKPVTAGKQVRLTD